MTPEGTKVTRQKAKVKTKKNNEASKRFKAITARAQEIREAHPKMQWKNAIKKASKELF